MKVKNVLQKIFFLIIGIVPLIVGIITILSMVKNMRKGFDR